MQGAFWHIRSPSHRDVSASASPVPVWPARAFEGTLPGVFPADALSIAAAQLAPCIACIFNACQRVAPLPRSWALCGITPIYKGEDT